MEENRKWREVSNRLRWEPNVHIVMQELSKRSDLPEYKGFSFGSNLRGDEKPFIEIDNQIIYKISLTCDLEFIDHKEMHMEFRLEDFSLELYQTEPEYGEMILMSLDEVIYYIGVIRNDEIKSKNDFPVLTACEYTDHTTNVNSKLREVRNTFFPTLNTKSLDLYFEDELKEVFAVASNALAFLYKHHDRVLGELKVLNNERYHSDLNIYPRFNNAISEVASAIYSIWERITFLINEFHPTALNPRQPPSFIQYMKSARKKVSKQTNLNTPGYLWLLSRFEKEHDKLGELRHPLIHYNDNRSPNGMRSTEMLKTGRKQVQTKQLAKQWTEELQFLKSELAQVSQGLYKAAQMIEEWAVINHSNTIVDHHQIS